MVRKEDTAMVRIDPKKQFSKKLARWTAIFWFLYMTWLSVILLLNSEAALYTVYMGIIVTVVMLLNIWTYLKNSVAEKAIFGMLDKLKLEMNLGPKTEGTDADEVGEEGDNG